MKELEKYIYDNIIPIYEKNDKAHSTKHVKTVIDNIIELSETLNLDKKMCLAIAAFHDIGHHIDAENHEKVSAEIFINDEFIIKNFSGNEIILMKEAIEDHRTSKKEEPRSIYGKVICSADRSIDLDDILKRTYDYGLHHYPNYTEEEQIQRVREHLTERFGKNGYSISYYETKNYSKNRNELIELLENEVAYHNKIKELIK